MAVADAVRAAADDVLAAVSAGPDGRSREEWLTLAGVCQAVVNTMTAAQDVAVAEAARREAVWLDDGTLGEATHGPGRVTIDAADVCAAATTA